MSPQPPPPKSETEGSYASKKIWARHNTAMFHVQVTYWQVKWEMESQNQKPRKLYSHISFVSFKKTTFRI